MKVFLWVFFLLFCAQGIFAEERDFPEIIDFSILKLNEIPGYENCDFEAISQFSPFNGAIELCPFFAYLKNTYSIEIAVETGTWLGYTAEFLGYLFKETYTMEIDVPTYYKAAEKLNHYPNIHLCYGNSPVILRQLLPQLVNQRLLFYLDAHWLSDWPLLAELEEISKTHKDNCVIVIDDFKVPGRKDIPYDSYGEHECSHEYIRNQLNKIFSGYKVHYLIPKSIQSRAKFVAIPKKWASKE